MGRFALSLRAALISLALAGFAASAAEVAGVTFAETVPAGDVTLALSNVAALRWKLLFRPYAGGFYVAAGVDPKRWREDVPKRLELAYFYDIAGEDFGPAGEEVLARNVPPETIAALKQPLAEIARLYVDVKAGDRYSLTYIPGGGTELARNGKPLGTVAGAEFAAAYFTIWLGEEPISGAFRDQLLTKR